MVSILNNQNLALTCSGNGVRVPDGRFFEYKVCVYHYAVPTVPVPETVLVSTIPNSRLYIDEVVGCIPLNDQTSLTIMASFKLVGVIKLVQTELFYMSAAYPSVYSTTSSVLRVKPKVLLDMGSKVQLVDEVYDDQLPFLPFVIIRYAELSE